VQEVRLTAVSTLCADDRCEIIKECLTQLRAHSLSAVVMSWSPQTVYGIQTVGCVVQH
jgi:hypothetical protein